MKLTKKDREVIAAWKADASTQYIGWMGDAGYRLSDKLSNSDLPTPIKLYTSNQGRTYVVSALDYRASEREAIHQLRVLLPILKKPRSEWSQAFGDARHHFIYEPHIGDNARGILCIGCHRIRISELKDIARRLAVLDANGKLTKEEE